ncbi:response regulator [Rhodococcus hoagii]|nr:response regulator [Prescottella equi]
MSETPQVRVLIVDDEPSLVELLSVSLRFQGFEVETATNGAEGSTRRAPPARRADPRRDDARMERVRDAAPTARRRRRRTRLFLTARDAEEDKLTGLTIGADDYVTKPFSSRRW